MRLKTEVPISKLMEHPMNRELFNDIQDTDPVFWTEFKRSIEEFGIIEPLIVNDTTKEIRSGNQRFKAAVQIGMETVPVLYVEDEASDEEIRKMIASNVYRRTIDPFAMFGLIGRLRRRDSQESRQGAVAKAVHKHRSFVSAADIFNELPEDQQVALKEWFETTREDERARTEGELIAMVRKLESDKDAIELSLTEEREKAEKFDRLAEELEKQIAEKDIQITELQNADLEGDIQNRDAEINKLLEQQAKLKEQIKTLKEAPDVNYLLIDCVKKQLAINAVLKPIVENAAMLNPGKLEELGKALKATLNIIQKGTTNNGQDGLQELLSD